MLLCLALWRRRPNDNIRSDTICTILCLHQLILETFCSQELSSLVTRVCLIHGLATERANHIVD